MSSAIAKKPRIVITRSREGNVELSRRLSEMGFEPIPADTLSFSSPASWIPVDAELKNIHEFDWLVFTSATGVRFFVQRMEAGGHPVPWTGRPRVAAVGPQTAKTLSRARVSVDFVPSRFLTRLLGEELPGTPGEKVLLLRADIADPVLPAALKRRGFSVRECAVYSTTFLLKEAEGAGMADAVVFASPSAVEGFCRATGDETLERLRGKAAFCIGPVTAESAKGHRFRNLVVPKVHTIDALLGEVEVANYDA